MKEKSKKRKKKSKKPTVSFNLRLTDEAFKAQLEKVANYDGRSLNGHINYVLYQNLLTRQDVLTYVTSKQGDVK